LVREFDIDAGEFGYVRPVFFADGRRSLWTFETESFAVVDHEAGKVLHWSDEHDAEITSIALSADESRILTASQDGTFRVWDADIIPMTTFPISTAKAAAPSEPSTAAAMITGPRRSRMNHTANPTTNPAHRPRATKMASASNRW